jgi:flagellar basal body-associated protein FliL
MRRILVALVLFAGLAQGPQALASAAKEEKPAGAANYLVLPTLTASVIRGDGRRRVLTVQAGLDVPEARLRDRAVLSQPRLRDAYVAALSAYAVSTTPLGPPDPEAIGTTLQRATDQVLGRPGARLLLGTIMIN